MKRAYLYTIAIFLFGCKQVNLPDEVSAIMPSIPSEIDYNLHVKQILSDKCFTCHGPDAKKQKAGLRLDLPAVALSKVTESGLKAIYPGKISQSEMVYRILSDDPNYRMPEPSSHLTLTAYEKSSACKMD